MRKNSIRTLVAAALISGMLVLPAYAETATVTGSEVNLRAGPGASYRVIDSLKPGTEVLVTDRSNASWYAVDVYGVAGFVSSSYLSIAGGTVTPPAEIITDNPASSASINAMYVRFRSGPGSDYSILGEYNKGKAVTVTGSSGGWTACVIDGRAGYVFTQFISVGSGQASGTDEYLDGYTPTSTPAPTATPTPAPTTTPAPPAIELPVSPELTPVPALTPTPELTPTPQPTATPLPTQTPTATPTPTVTPTPTAVPTPAQTATISVAGYINGDYVRFRTGPSTSYSIIDSYNTGKALTATGVSGDWTMCTIDGQSGYVFSKYVTRTETAAPPSGGTSEATPTPAPTATPAVSDPQSTAGYVNGNNVRMRSGPTMASEIIGELFFGNAVTITGVSGDWTAVTYNGEAGFIYSQYVKTGTYSYDTTTSTGSAQGQEIAKFALQFVGTNYCWGGTSPDTGFDCSGLVYYVYQHFGYTLNRVAADQAMNGVHVDNLEPGDVLCFYSGSSYIGHSGIYIGDGKFVHSANSSTGVIVTELSGYYSTRGYEARRIVTTE